MKKIFLIIVAILSFCLVTNAQNKEEKARIEVTGVAELKVIPNEIYLSIELNEKDFKDHKSLKSLENTVVNVLRKMNIPLENFSIAGANSKLEKAFWSGKKIYAQKSYVLKLTDANTIGKVLEELENVGISNINLIRVGNDKMEEYKKEVKIKAIKDAKQKADYLLEAINAKTGKPIFVQENNYQPRMYNSTIRLKGNNSLQSDYELEFESMTLRYEIFVRFEIIE